MHGRRFGGPKQKQEGAPQTEKGVLSILAKKYEILDFFSLLIKVFSVLLEYS